MCPVLGTDASCVSQVNVDFNAIQVGLSGAMAGGFRGNYLYQSMPSKSSILLSFLKPS